MPRQFTMFKAEPNKLQHTVWIFNPFAESEIPRLCRTHIPPPQLIDLRHESSHSRISSAANLPSDQAARCACLSFYMSLSTSDVEIIAIYQSTWVIQITFCVLEIAHMYSSMSVSRWLTLTMRSQVRLPFERRKKLNLISPRFSSCFLWIPPHGASWSAAGLEKTMDRIDCSVHSKPVHTSRNCDFIHIAIYK